MCAGRGVCLDGVLGIGDCVCTHSFSTGFWGGVACVECLSGYYGAECLLRCPTDTASAVCSGHGTCHDGRGGDGACTCDAHYAGTACGTACPVANGAVCNGVGVCHDGAAGEGTCDCSGASRGYWTGAACADCATGWVGSYCDLQCPAGPDRTPCAGHGACYAEARAARCACVSGYADAACATECPGGALNPCSGHGRCDAATATCACDSSNATGHWGGAACDTCALGWSGEGCGIACPRSAGGMPCGGARCWKGLCICPVGACGPACEITGTGCSEYVCPPGLWGPGCAQECPGGVSDVCSGHGACQALVYGNGGCECASGWAGMACGQLCPGDADAPCSGHGLCVQATATCDCQATYATAACSVQCPVAGGRVCAGHGQCRDGAAQDGACTCDPGYAKPSCGTECPGRGPGAQVCSGHGACDAVTAACACDAAWAGVDCGACAPGLFGEDCSEVCWSGRTQGRVCVCDTGYGLPNCSAVCPGEHRNCSGHGLCLDGNTRNGSCACDPGWFSENCSVACAPEACFPADILPAPHAQCNPGTGACECQENDAGHWGGPQCNRCRVGFWGQQCDLVCMCSGHGGCGWLDGVCECFRDDVLGHWAGDRCESCADGYLVPLCVSPNVRISRSGDLTAVSEGLRYDGTSPTVIDEAYALVYCGGQPLLVFHSDDGAPAATLMLNGVVRAGFTGTQFVTLLLEVPGQASHELVRITRGLPPILWKPGPPTAQRSRALHPQAVAPVVRFAELFERGGLVYVAMLDDQELQLQVQGPDLALLHNEVLPAAHLSLDVVRAGKVWEHPTLGTVLVLVGSSRNAWQIVMVTLPPNAVAYPLADRVAIPDCTATGYCLAAGNMVMHRGTLLVAFENADSLLLAKLQVEVLANASSVEVPCALHVLAGCACDLPGCLWKLGLQGERNVGFARAADLCRVYF